MCMLSTVYICTSYLQLIDICMQLLADELTNQNREYYKVNDNPQPAKRRRNDVEKWLKTQMESTLRYRRCFDV